MSRLAASLSSVVLLALAGVASAGTIGFEVDPSTTNGRAHGGWNFVEDGAYVEFWDATGASLTGSVAPDRFREAAGNHYFSSPPVPWTPDH